MSEIKIGEYVRTEYGEIDKVRGYDDDNNLLLDSQLIVPKKEIKSIKHSEDILDLVTIEDILKIKDDENTIIYLGFTNDYAEEYAETINAIKNKEIELLEVLTKEQFLANSYKVGE